MCVRERESARAREREIESNAVERGRTFKQNILFIGACTPMRGDVCRKSESVCERERCRKSGERERKSDGAPEPTHTHTHMVLQSPSIVFSHVFLCVCLCAYMCMCPTSVFAGNRRVNYSNPKP